MYSALQTLHVVAGVIVLAEALNKLERATPFARGMSAHDRWVHGLEALAWALLALGGAGALAAPLLLSLGVQSHQMPLMRLERPTLAEVCVLAGFAVLIVRTRVKEG